MARFGNEHLAKGRHLEHLEAHWLNDMWRGCVDYTELRLPDALMAQIRELLNDVEAERELRGPRPPLRRNDLN